MIWANALSSKTYSVNPEMQSFSKIGKLLPNNSSKI